MDKGRWMYFDEVGELQFLPRATYFSQPGWEYRFSAEGDDGQMWDIVSTGDLSELRYTKI